MNKIISIGYTGLMKCYLNVSKAEACRRYIDSEGIDLRNTYPNKTDEEIIENSIGSISEIIFNDEFSAYSIYD